MVLMGMQRIHDDVTKERVDPDSKERCKTLRPEERPQRRLAERMAAAEEEDEYMVYVCVTGNANIQRSRACTAKRRRWSV
jgi:hypothetical protein